MGSGQGAPPRESTLENILQSTSRRQNERQPPVLQSTLRGTPSPLLTQRDGYLLRALGRMRLLSYSQIARLVFAGRADAIAHRRIRTLQERGWVTTWEEPTVRGGHPRYVLPTRAGLTRALDELSAEGSTSPADRLVQLVTPAAERKPLALSPGVVPAFLAHQREVNHLLISFERSPAFQVLWASSWDRPFPSTDDGLSLPQPDYVVVFAGPNGPRLIFGEHDRGHESLAHFTTAKVDRYAALATMPDVCERLFGFPTFEVWVTVIDARFRHPVRRLRELARAAAAGSAASVMRFALGGWVFDAPAEAVWFKDGAWAEGDSVRRQDHHAECSSALNASPDQGPCLSESG